MRPSHRTRRLPGLLVAIVVAGAVSPAAAWSAAGEPAYYPSGPQLDVPASALAGWTACHQDTYASSARPVASILAECDKPYLMLAARPAGSAIISLLAAAPRADVITDTGRGNVPHDANGSGWYFNASWSWGFAKAGDPIDRNSCDIGAVNGSLRLCWHTAAGVMNAGYRLGTATTFSGDVERVVYEADGARAAPTAALTASPATAEAEELVTFDGSASSAAPGGTIASWSLDFGDGQSTGGAGAPGASIAHRYSTVGTHTATLTVTDDGAVTATATVDVSSTKVTTRLVARPLIASVGTLQVHLGPSAVLSRASSGTPIAGRAVTFSANGNVLCTATTDLRGVAACSDPASLLRAVLAGGYDATAAGDALLTDASAHAGLIAR